MADEQNNPSDLEILTCSASDYAKMQGRDLTAYIPVAINTEDTSSLQDGQFWNKPYVYLISIAKNKGCVAVVDLRSVFDSNFSRMHYTGTGLILKKIDANEKDKQGVTK